MTKSTAEPQTRSPEQAMLDAARAEFERYGVRRTNMDDIARRAGVSRSTLYRRFPNKDVLFERLVLADTDELFRKLDRMAAGRDPQSAVVECFVLGLATINEMPLARGILESEPELLFGLTNRTQGLPITRAAELVAGSLRRSGVTMSDEDLHAVSEILIRLTMSVLLNPQGQLDITDPAAVRRYSERYLARLVW
jgi:AcrR family transcriptional regulator